MTRLARLLRNQSGAGAAEFALVLPVAILFLLGIIDAGRYAWALNRIEKAVQSGARYAVTTDIVPDQLNGKSFIGFNCPSGTLTPGQPICAEALGTITCSIDNGSASCVCVPTSAGSASCANVTGSPDSTALNNIVQRVRVIDPSVTPDLVNVIYSGSGIGFAGDPRADDDGNQLSEVAPVVTVEVESVAFRLFFLLGATVDLPAFSYSLTLEDGEGARGY